MERENLSVARHVAFNPILPMAIIKRRIAKFNRILKIAALGSEFVGIHSQKKNPSTTVVSKLSSLHGLPQKVAQLLGHKSVGLDDGVLTETEHSSICLDEVKRRFIDELGPEAWNRIAWLGPYAFEASIGKVLKACLVDGRDVAIKIQHPNMEEQLETDLSMLGMAALPATAKLGRSKLREYKAELRTSLLREVDYSHELSTLNLFSGLSSVYQDIATPKGIKELSSKHLLTMDWIGGVQLSKLKEICIRSRAFILRSLIRLFLFGVFRCGTVHADPHPGNFSLINDKDGDLKFGVYDFGCSMTLRDEKRTALISLLMGEIPESPAQLLSLYADLGFDIEMLEPLSSRLHSVTSEIIRPFTYDGVFDISSWHPSVTIAEILGEHRLNFRLAGPASLLPLVRILTGILRYNKNFQANINWREEVRIIADLGYSLPHKAQDKQLALSDPRNLTRSRQSKITNAESLCVKIEENGLTKAMLRFKPELTESLEDLIPPEVMISVRGRGIDLLSIIEQSRARHHAPADLFHFHEGNRSCRVWLE